VPLNKKFPKKLGVKYWSGFYSRKIISLLFLQIGWYFARFANFYRNDDVRNVNVKRSVNDWNDNNWFGGRNFLWIAKTPPLVWRSLFSQVSKPAT